MLYSFSFSIVDKSCVKIIFFFMSIKRGSSLLRLKHDFLSSLNQASSLSQFMDIGLVCIYMSSPGLCMMCTWRVDEMLAARFQTAPFCVAKNMQFWRFFDLSQLLKKLKVQNDTFVYHENGQNRPKEDMKEVKPSHLAVNLDLIKTSPFILLQLSRSDLRGKCYRRLQYTYAFSACFWKLNWLSDKISSKSSTDILFGIFKKYWKMAEW